MIDVGLSIQDLGYKEMSLQLEYDLLAIKAALRTLEHGKMPDWGSMALPEEKDKEETPREWNWK